MRGIRDAELEELAAAIAVARIVLGPAARIQAPPNLVDGGYARFVAGGIDDCGVSPLTVYGDWEATREQAASGMVTDQVDAHVKAGRPSPWPH